MAYIDILRKLPSVGGPQKKLDFRSKLQWTLLMLVLFYLMTEIFIWGVSPDAVRRFTELETLLGSKMGTLVTLGIGPLVTSSIILQLLVGSKIISWDTSTQDGKTLFMGTQKVLGVLFCFFEAAAFVLFGAIPPMSQTPLIIGALIFQLALGGILVMFMDEVVSKWGFGSGISLFIAAGVSRTIFIEAIGSPSIGWGRIPRAVFAIAEQNPLAVGTLILPVIFTAIVFMICVYAQALRVEVPLAFGQIRGFGTRWPLKFFYTSNIPVILTSALLANFRLFGTMLSSRGINILGTFDGNGTPISGLLHYITPPRGSTLSDIIIALGSGVSVPANAKSVSEQIQKVGLGIPGFRRDPRIIEKVLDRYIPYLAVLGGASVGVLAAFADFTGALGTGTGILLTVMIIHNLYEDVVSKHMEDMHPALQKFMR
ncbi:MAG: preprotein translocase subunit SecY [Candidatus Aenigmarchaeota archaeon]|nr:preprotein translocase subunit SecY [Candidatus Aenigmarchaeota archaeon]